MKEMNKKGQYGLNVVITVALALFVLLLIAIAIIVGSNSLVTTTIFPTTSGTTLNEAITPTDAGTALGANSYPGCTGAVITRALNGSTVIGATNYTVTGCLLKNLTSVYADSAWKVNYTYIKYSDSYNQINGIVNNNSNALSTFFGNSTTFFSILAVTVIMIFLGLMIGAVYLFTRRREGGL